jgi:hypothetical protein
LTGSTIILAQGKNLKLIFIWGESIDESLASGTSITEPGLISLYLFTLHHNVLSSGMQGVAVIQGSGRTKSLGKRGQRFGRADGNLLAPVIRICSVFSLFSHSRLNL